MDPVTSLFQTMQTLVDLLITTPPEFTTANRVVIGTWTTMTAVADAFFVLTLIIGATQIMYSQSTGTLSMPVSQFIAKAIVTALLIHLSFFIGQDLLMLNNLLCALLPANVQDLIRQMNGGQSFNNTQLLSLSFVLTLVFGLSSSVLSFRQSNALSSLMYYSFSAVPPSFYRSIPRRPPGSPSGPEPMSSQYLLSFFNF